MTRWIKMPSPGQLRGQGEWMTIAEAGVSNSYWRYCQRSSFLPTADQIVKPGLMPEDQEDKPDE